MVFRLVFCPAELCAHTMAENTNSETQAAESKDQASASLMPGASAASPVGEEPCHGKKSEQQTDSKTGASCCNDETVTDSPTTPALSITEVFLERLAAVVRQPVEFSVLNEASADYRSGPPDGIRLHLKNQTFLN